MVSKPLPLAFRSVTVGAIPVMPPPAAALLKLPAPGAMIVLWGKGRWACGGYEVACPQERLSVPRCGDGRGGDTGCPWPLYSPGRVVPAAAYAYWPVPSLVPL